MPEQDNQTGDQKTPAHVTGSGETDMIQRGVDEMMRQHEALVRRVIRRTAPDAMGDDDAVQSAMIGLWEACVHWDGVRPFRPFARSCIRHNLIDYLRSRPPDGQDEDWQEDGREDNIPDRDLMDEIRRAMPGRSRDRRVLLLLARGMSKEEIADRMGVSKRTVQRCAVRAWESVMRYRERQGET